MTNIICRECSFAIIEEQLFCPECGSSVSEHGSNDQFIYINREYHSSGELKNVSLRAREPLMNMVVKIAILRMKKVCNEKDLKSFDRLFIIGDGSSRYDKDYGYIHVETSYYCSGFNKALFDVMSQYDMSLVSESDIIFGDAFNRTQVFTRNESIYRIKS